MVKKFGIIMIVIIKISLNQIMRHLKDGDIDMMKKMILNFFSIIFQF